MRAPVTFEMTLEMMVLRSESTPRSSPLAWGRTLMQMSGTTVTCLAHREWLRSALWTPACSEPPNLTEFWGRTCLLLQADSHLNAAEGELEREGDTQAEELRRQEGHSCLGHSSILHDDPVFGAGQGLGHTVRLPASKAWALYPAPVQPRVITVAASGH